MLDATLSTEYVLELSEDMMYISDNEDSDCKEAKNKDSHFSKLNEVIDIDSEQLQPTSIKDKSPFASCESIIPWILKSPRCPKLQGIIHQTQEIRHVEEIPQQYNGDVIFELSPYSDATKRMEGMEQKYDGHIWTRPQKANMSIDCTVRLSYCLGSLVCQRITCPYFVTNKKFNTSYFHGYLDRQVNKGLLCQDDKLGIKCHYCKKNVFCAEPCSCKVYYILPFNPKMTRLMVHTGQHSHEVQSGTSRAAVERIRKMVATVMRVDRQHGPRKVQMIVARQLLVDAIVGQNEQSFGESELSNILEEMIPLVQTQRLV